MIQTQLPLKWRSGPIILPCLAPATLPPSNIWLVIRLRNKMWYIAAFNIWKMKQVAASQRNHLKVLQDLCILLNWAAQICCSTNLPSSKCQSFGSWYWNFFRIETMHFCSEDTVLQMLEPFIKQTRKWSTLCGENKVCTKTWTSRQFDVSAKVPSWSTTNKYWKQTIEIAANPLVLCVAIVQLIKIARPSI